MEGFWFKTRPGIGGEGEGEPRGAGEVPGHFQLSAALEQGSEAPKAQSTR